MKNRCQEALYVGFQILIDFWSVFAANLDPLNPIFRAPAAGRARFSKKKRFATGIDFWSILVPTCLHFPSQNSPKSLQKPILKAIEFLIDFLINFYAVLAPTWDLLGPQVGAILALKIVQSRPKRLPRRIWEPEPAQTPKMTPKWSPRPPKMVPQTLHFGSILVLFFVIFRILIQCAFFCGFQV